MATRENAVAHNEARVREVTRNVPPLAYGALYEILVACLCECEDPRCDLTVRLTVPEYRAIRAHSGRSVLAAEHERRPDTPRAA